MDSEFLVVLIIDFSARMAHVLSSRRVTLPLFSRPLFLCFPREVIIHGCSEPVNRVSPLLQPAGPDMAPRQEVQRCCGSRQSEASACSCAGCVLHKHMCPCILEIQVMLYLPSHVPFFLICIESLSTCQDLCLLNSIHQRGYPVHICKNQFLCAKVSLPGLEPRDLGDCRLDGHSTDLLTP